MPRTEGLDYNEVRDAIEASGISELERLHVKFPDFPAKLHSDILLDALDISSEDVVIWLIEKGADTNFKDAGYTPLHIAIESRSPLHVLEKPIEHGADVNQHGVHDWTPLHMAAVRQHFRAIEILVDAGADPEIETRIDSYATAAQEARLLGQERGASFLENYLSNPKRST